MKICITSNGPNLDSAVDPRFGRCLYFIFIDNKKPKKFDVISNEGVNAMRGAGIQAAQTVVNQGAEAVITGNVGPNALNVLRSSGIKVFQAGPSIKISNALTAFEKEELSEIIQPLGNGFGRGMGRGTGRGIGRGQRYG